jgi:hypothetical protein
MHSGAFDLLIERCATDEPCARELPLQRTVLEHSLRELERTPAIATIRHPRTGQRATVTLTRDAVAEIVRVALYTPIDAARVLLLRKAVEGDFAPLLAQFVHSASFTINHMALGTTMAEVVVFMPWIWSRLYRNEALPGASVELFSWGLLTTMTLLGAGYLVALTRWARREQSQLEDLRAELLGES